MIKKQLWLKKIHEFIKKNKDYFFIVFLFFPDYLFYPSLLYVILSLTKKAVTKKLNLNKPSTYIFTGFALYTFLIALINQNIMGMVAPLWIFVIILFSAYLRQIATPRRYMKIQFIIAFCSIFSFIFNFFDYRIPYISSAIQSLFSQFTQIAYQPEFVQYPERLFSTFDNPNYYAFIVLIVLLICFNQIQFQFTLRNYRLTVFYGLVFILNLIALSLTDTRTVYPALIIGMFTILLVQKKFKQLRIIAALAIGTILFVIIMPDFMPRFHQLSQGFDIRTTIWDTAIKFIESNPLWGDGFFTYHHLAGNLGIPLEIHSHSLYLEPLLSFGLVGTAILVFGLLHSLSRSVFRTSYYDRPLALAVIVSTLCYGFFDIPLIGIQTSLLFVIIMALPLRKEKSMLK